MLSKADVGDKVDWIRREEETPAQTIFKAPCSTQLDAHKWILLVDMQRVGQFRAMNLFGATAARHSPSDIGAWRPAKPTRVSPPQG